jgi:hypothetical protein
VTAPQTSCSWPFALIAAYELLIRQVSRSRVNGWPGAKHDDEDNLQLVQGLMEGGSSRHRRFGSVRIMVVKPWRGRRGVPAGEGAVLEVVQDHAVLELAVVVLDPSAEFDQPE